MHYGLVSYVVPDGTALDKAREVAAQVAANGPLAVEAILQTLRATEHMSEEEAFAFEQPIGMAVMASADSKEGPKAFAEKRTPELPAEVARRGASTRARRCWSARASRTSGSTTPPRPPRPSR